MWILCNNYLKPYGSVQRPRVSKYGLKTFLFIFWNSSCVPHERLLEVSLSVTLYVNYHKLSQVANKYCSHYDKTSKNCGPWRLQDNARKHTTKQCFSALNCYAHHHSPYSSIMAYKNWFFYYYSSMHMHKQRKEDISQSNSAYIIH